MLFDQVADLYDATRYGYATEVLDLLFETAALEAGDPVLEVGCGTGQLTIDLAQRQVAVTAIDIAPAMIRRAQRKAVNFDVRFEVCAFEEFDAPDGSFAAVVSATAFHWVDPEAGLRRAADLLRPDGWLAILSTAERYDDPLGAAYREQWIRYSEDGGARASAPRPTLTDVLESSGLFSPLATHTHEERRTLDAELVIALEQTRATTLSFDDSTRRAFVADLRSLLGDREEVPLTQVTALTLAQRT